MEINATLKDLHCSLKFKIDLIVWKSDYKVEKSNNGGAFKIDLIVWKYNGKIDINDIKRRFKIDLIVWKYCNNENAKMSSFGLK